jgi:hypothetical protein
LKLVAIEIEGRMASTLNIARDLEQEKNQECTTASQ